MRIMAPKRLSLENIPEEQIQLASEIANIINNFNDEVANVINGNIGLDNMRAKVVQLNVQTDANGNVPPFDVKADINPTGCTVINIYMTANPSQVPNITAAPFVCFSPIGNGNIKVTKILNLQKNSKYTITLKIE